MSVDKQRPNTISFTAGQSAVNPMYMETPCSPSSESAHSGRSSGPEDQDPGERSRTVPRYVNVNYANLPTTGYAHAVGLHGLTDVDVDEKTGVAYGTTTEVQLQQNRMMNLHMETGDKCAGIPDKKTSCSSSVRLMFGTLRVIFLLLIFILSAGALILSVYCLLDKGNINKVVTEVPTEVIQSEMFSLAQFVELNETVAEMRDDVAKLSALVEQISAAHGQELNTHMSTMERSVQNVSLGNYSSELDLYSECFENSASCVIDRNEVSTESSSYRIHECETARLDLDREDGLRNMNIYCSVDNSGEEKNPIIATLNIFGGEATCLCSLIAHNGTATTFSPPCMLTILRCPTTIKLNTTSST